MMKYIISVVLIFSMHASALASDDWNYLSEFPETSVIEKKIKGNNQQDTWARQLGCIRQLGFIIARVNAYHGNYGIELSPKEAEVMAKYDALSKSTLQRVDVTLGELGFGENKKRSAWEMSCNTYGTEARYAEEFISILFSEEWRNHYKVILDDVNAKASVNMAIAEHQRELEANPELAEKEGRMNDHYFLTDPDGRISSHLLAYLILAAIAAILYGLMRFSSPPSGGV